MQIRRAHESDRERMLMVWERSVRASHHFLTAADVDVLRPLVAQELASDRTDWWVIESASGDLVGLLACSPGAIDGLFVDPDHYGRGAGTLLIAHAQALCGGVLTVDVNEQNTAARAFYASRGFVVVGRSATDAGGRPFPLLHLRRE